MKISAICSLIVIYTYSGLLDLIRLALFPLLRKPGKKRGWDLEARQKLPVPLKDFRGKTVIWLHAASLGEAKLLVKFHSILRQHKEDDLYLVTATTRNGVAYLEKNRQPAFCAIGFLPIDTISLVTKIVSHYSVRRLWLLETEIWPSLLHVCRANGIPVGIANGRIEPSSFRWYSVFRWFVSTLLEKVDTVFAQSDEYAERFIMLGVKSESVHVVGNIKGHIRIQRPLKDEWHSVRRALSVNDDDFVVTAGCIHTGEGKAVRIFFDRMVQYGYPCRLIVVPRYNNEAASIVDEIGGQVLHLDKIETSRHWEICVIEKVGILDDMYKAADAAVIGGTFVDIGGHNVWDAACFGIPVFFGPMHHTQKESCAQLVDAGVGFTVSDGEALAEKMFSVVRKNPLPFFDAQQQFIETTNRAQSELEPLLP